jgi:glycosyltransferase involved in cell wall biosynthesis
VVDTGSVDKTREIAEKYTDKVFDFTWIDDFAAARNYSFSKATKEYCMWLDADDVILKKDQKAFQELKEILDQQIDVIMLPYHTAFDEAGNPTFLYYRERIVRNNENYRWDGEVHEAITPSGVVIHKDAAVTHKKIRTGDSDRNLRILENKYKSGKTMPPRQKFYYGQELYFHKRYSDAVRILEKFLQENGWIENQLEACKLLSFCYMRKGDKELALKSLLRSFELDVPRAEICCELGHYFFEQNAYLQAIFWYELALSRPYDAENGSFVLVDYYGYIPNIQLAVCYDRIGKWEIANQYNERAGEQKPDSEQVKGNRIYFKNKLKQIKGENNNEL